MRNCFITFIFLLLAAVASAQEPLEYPFSHYSTSSGLLSNQVFAVVQDNDGYLWIGTTDGLQRFDGIRYKTFRHRTGDSSSIPSNPVSKLLIDKKKRLWLLMNDGKVGIFDTKKFTFREITVKLKNRLSIYTSEKQLSMDEYGNIFYLFGGSEVVTWNEQANEFSYAHNFFKQKATWRIADFKQQPGTQKYWIGVEGGGMAVYNRATDKLSYKADNAEKEQLVEQSDSLISYHHFFFDRQQRFWFIHWTTLPLIDCFDFTSGKKELVNVALNYYLNSYHEIHGFFQQQDGTVWVRGMLVFAKFLEKEKKFQFVKNGYHNERSIAFEMLHCLYEDGEQNIWVATGNNGLYRFNPATNFFRSIKHTNRITGKAGEGSPMSFLSTQWGTILVGTWGDGLYHYDSDFNPIPVAVKGLDEKGGPFAWSMFASADSNSIWISSQPGIYRIDQQKRSSRFYDPPALQHKTVRQVVEDKHGNLWLGMHTSGLFKWKVDSKKEPLPQGPERVAGIPITAINKLMIDRAGLLWVGTPLNGVYAIDPASEKIVLNLTKDGPKGYRLPEEGVSSLLELDDSIVIITTSTRIVQYNRLTRTTQLIGGPDIISGFIASVEKDTEGGLWISSTSGLYRVNLKHGGVIGFNKDDGIQNENFVLAASRLLPNGRLLFGASNQFIAFNPAAIKTAGKKLAITLTGFEVMNRELPVDSLLNLKEVELGYQENSIRFSFSTLTFNTPVMIKYKLEGLDNDWRINDKNYEAIYPYLPPGSYKLLFKMLYEDGTETDSAIKLSFRINPPFYQRWWFLSMLILLVGVVLFWLDRQRMKRRESLYQMRNDIAGKLHQEVNTALSNINVLSEMAMLKAGVDPKKSNEFIEQIHTRSGSMIGAMEDMLWAISPQNDSVEKIIERLKEQIAALRSTHGVDISLLVDENIELLDLDMKQRQDIYWLLKNGLSNITKNGGQNILMHIGIESSWLVYTLEFDSSDMNMQQFNNLLQRQELVNKLKDMKGKLNFSTAGSNSVIELKLPI